MKRNWNVQYGPWALVTGASSGIGAEFARLLAMRGLNVVLVARRREALERLAEELEKAWGVEVRPLAADLSDPDALDHLEQATADLEIGLLINNAGVAAPGAFVWHREAHVRDTLAVNVYAPALLAHRLGRKMAARGRGGIVFVASTFGLQPVPYFQNYAATKAYVLALGDALSVELRRHGVDVTVLTPGPTRTAMAEMPGFDFSKLPLPWMNVRPVVTSALDRLGRKSVVIPGTANRLMAWMGRRMASSSALSRSFGRMVGRGLAPERAELRTTEADDPAASAGNAA